MTQRVGLLAPVILMVSGLWIVWLFFYLPTQSISQQQVCSELQDIAQTQVPAFVPQCIEMMDKGSDKAAVQLLVVTCIALMFVSIVLLLRERKRGSL